MAGIAQRSVGRHLSKMAAEATAKQASKQFAKQGENSVKRVINNMKKVPKTRVSQPRNFLDNRLRAAEDKLVNKLKQLPETQSPEEAEPVQENWDSGSYFDYDPGL